MFRLEGFAGRPAKPKPKESDADPDEYWRDVFDAGIRMMPDPREEFGKEPEEYRPTPRFQWRGSELNHWRDRETDAETKQDRVVWERDQGVQVQTNMAIAMLRSLLARMLATADLHRVEETWYRDGPPSDVVDVF